MSEFATYTFEKTYHVGNLNGERETNIESHEGKGVSISPVPDAWRHIAPCVGGYTYRLHKPGGGNYLDYSNLEDGAQEAFREFCLDAEYVVPATAYEIRYEDAHGDVRRFHRDTREDAERSAREESYRNASVEEVETVDLGPKGREYWTDAFGTDPDDAGTIFVETLLEIWYAEEHGFDGVYWDNELSIGKLSAPKGVIFQSMFSEWEIVERQER